MGVGTSPSSSNSPKLLGFERNTTAVPMKITASPSSSRRQTLTGDALWPEVLALNTIFYELLFGVFPFL